MSDLGEVDDRSEDDLLAAEYALGVLDGGARRRLDRRLRGDEAMVQRVAAWDARFAPFLATIEAVEPPATLWSGIEADLERMLRFRAPAVAGVRTERGVSRLWKWLGLGSFGLLAASLAGLFVLLQPRPVQAPFATLIVGQGGPALYAAVVDPRLARATLVPVATGADAAHSRQLWLIGPDARPKSLGVLPAEGPVQVIVSPELLGAGIVLAISQEPLGGSPTGQPTGPVVGQGALEKV